MKGRKEGWAFRLYIKRSENIGTRWNDLKGGLPFELSSQIRLQVDEGEKLRDGMRPSGEVYRSSARGDTKEEPSSGWKRALKAPTAIIPRRYIVNVLPPSTVCFFSNRLRIAAENPSRSRCEDLRMNEGESPMYLYNHGYDWRKRRSTARQITLKPIAYRKYEFALG